MKRSLEPIDLVVAVGVLATVVCGYLMFMASSGNLYPRTEIVAEVRTPTVADAMQWVQPALGQAIVDEAILESELASELTREVRQLNRVFMTDQWLKAAPVGFIDRVHRYAAAVERDHAARMQWVMGRTIVNATLRGVRSGMLSAGHSQSDFSRALVGQAAFIGGRMDEAFREGWQERLGRMIVASSQDYQEIVEQNQERIGSSIVGVAETQDAFRTKQEAVQVQLASAAIAAVRGDQIADGFAHLKSADSGTMFQAYPVQTRSWPEIPVGMFFMASLALVGIFIAGILMPLPRPSPRMQESDYRAGEERYRKTA